MSCLFRDGIQPIHLNETAWHLAPRIHFALAVGHRRGAYASAKQGAERTQTLEAYLETDVGNAQFSPPQEFFRPLNSAMNQVLMRRGIERVTK